MLRLNIYDGNNFVRRIASTDMSGRPIRTAFNELAYSPEPVVVVWDGPNGLAKRREIYPEYKAHREPAADGVYESMELLRNLLQCTKAIQVRVPGYEADDVIATLVRRYKPDLSIFLHSNDADFAALGVPMAREEFKIPPRWVRLYKACVGDRSDNIPGIKGFGQKTWDSLDDEGRSQLENLLASNSNDRETIPVLPKAVRNWLSDRDNLKLARTFYRIVGFLDVPFDLIDQHTVVGTPCVEKAVEVLQEYDL